MREQWSDFFLAEAGAAAALAGLLFVAISINVASIAKDRVLAGRAAETITILVGALIVSSLLLVPAEDSTWPAIAVLLVAIAIWAIPIRQQADAWPRLVPVSRQTFPQRVLMSQIATMPAIVGGALLVADAGAAYPVLAFGILASFVIAVANAWVLLIEILR